MSLARYTFAVWLIFSATILIPVIDLAETWTWELALKVAVGVPLISGAVAMRLAQTADGIPVDQRSNFWAYRQTNIILAALVATVLLCYVMTVAGA